MPDTDFTPALMSAAEERRLEREQDWALGRELERKDAEIERLRAALRKIRTKADAGHVTENNLNQIGHIADEALAGVGHEQDADGAASGSQQVLPAGDDPKRCRT